MGFFDNLINTVKDVIDTITTPFRPPTPPPPGEYKPEEHPSIVPAERPKIVPFESIVPLGKETPAVGITETPTIGITEGGELELGGGYRQRGGRIITPQITPTIIRRPGRRPGTITTVRPAPTCRWTTTGNFNIMSDMVTGVFNGIKLNDFKWVCGSKRRIVSGVKARMIIGGRVLEKTISNGSVTFTFNDIARLARKAGIQVGTGVPAGVVPTTPKTYGEPQCGKKPRLLSGETNTGICEPGRGWWILSPYGDIIRDGQRGFWSFEPPRNRPRTW